MRTQSQKIWNVIQQLILESLLRRWVETSQWRNLYADDAWIYNDLYVSPQKHHGRFGTPSPPIH